MWMISMKAVLDIVSKYCPDDDGSCSKAGVDLREMLDEIEGLDETEVQPVKHGRWEICCDGYYPYCSNCKKEPQGREMTDFCPNCGCYMRDGDKDA